MPRAKKQKEITAPALIWKRIFAFAIDIFLINFIVLIPFQGLIDEVVPDNASFSELMDFFSSNSDLASTITLVSFFAGILALLYFVILEKKFNQTIGKKIFSIYVTSDNKELKTWQVVVRSLFLVPIFPLILLVIVDPLFMLFNKKNKRLSEILSKTQVLGKYKV